jgi:outer membrane protein
MMKKLLLMALLALTVTMPIVAQSEAATVSSMPQTELAFGYLSCTAALQSMPEYATVQNDLELLRQQYEAEQKRVENDFNSKYEEFLDGQKSFPKTILQKRQSELQEMLDKNIAFKKESQRLLADAEARAMAPLKSRLSAALATIGSERGYAFILDTDQQSTLWLNPAMGEDITATVQQLLQQ